MGFSFYNLQLISQYQILGGAMIVVNTNQVAEEPATGALFTGGDVTRQSLVTEQMGKDFVASIVNFSTGARNKFHSHTSDQILVVTKGTGIVATEQEEIVVGVGDVIHFPAVEKHWHGATKDSEFSHIFIFAVGNKTTQLED